MTAKSSYEKALDVLKALLWCHENQDCHLLAYYEFDRMFAEAWDSAKKLYEEKPPAADTLPSGSPSSAICGETVTHFLAEAIKGEVFDEGALVWQARMKVSDDSEAPLAAGETPETVGNTIWARGDTGDIAQAAKNCGAINAYFYIARHFDLALPIEAKNLEEWGDTISPA